MAKQGTRETTPSTMRKDTAQLLYDSVEQILAMILPPPRIMDGVLVGVVKADPVISFMATQKHLAGQLRKKFNKESRDYIKKASSQLAKGTGNVKAAERSKLITLLDDVVGSKFTPEAAGEIRGAVAASYAAGQVAAHPQKVMSGFNVRDQRSIDFISNNNVYWVGKTTNKNLRMAVSRTVQEGLDQGFGRKDIAASLRDVVPELESKSDAYLSVVASSAVQTSRNMGQVAVFELAGIVSVVFFNPLDERTSETCEYLEGTVWTIEQVTIIRDSYMGASSPDDVKAAVPWMSASDVKTIGGSKKDPGKLAEAGVVIPPLHGECRSSLNAEDVGTESTTTSSASKLATDPQANVVKPATKEAKRIKPTADPVSVQRRKVQDSEEQAAKVTKADKQARKEVDGIIDDERYRLGTIADQFIESGDFAYVSDTLRDRSVVTNHLDKYESLLEKKIAKNGMSLMDLRIDLMDEWVESSRSGGAQLMKSVVSERWNRSTYYTSKFIDDNANELRSFGTFVDELLTKPESLYLGYSRGDVEELLSLERAINRKIFRKVYGPGRKIHIHRGIGERGYKRMSGSDLPEDGVATGEMVTDSLSSWTGAPEIADGFAKNMHGEADGPEGRPGVRITIEVGEDDIAFSTLTNRDLHELEELEIVPIGGKFKYAARGV